MPLSKGLGSVRQNMQELMQNVDSPARKKAILTLAKKHNISYEEAKFRQAKAIAKNQARKK